MRGETRGTLVRVKGRIEKLVEVREDNLEEKMEIQNVKEY